MNFGEKENFYERHQYFFQAYSFKFEGLEPLLEKRFETIVTQLSGTVSKDAYYILCEETYFDKCENKNRTDLYSLMFILDSIEAKEPLNIEEYRFKSTKFIQQSQDSCCLGSKYILRTNSCLRYYHDNVRCQKCSLLAVDDSNTSSCKNFVNDSRKRKADVEHVSSSEFSSTRIIEIPSQNCVNEKNTRKNKKQKRIVYVHDDWRLLPMNNNTIDTDDHNQDIGRNDKDDTEPTEQENSDNDIDLCSSNATGKWWTCLPQPSKSKTVMETMYQKGQRRRGYDFTIMEKRLMIAYLIIRNKIKEGSTQQVWRDMQAEGYLNSNRSVESLRNHYRKVILPKIHTYGLPENIVQEFL